MEQKWLFRNLVGVFYLDQKRIKVGEEFEALPSRIPASFMDTLEKIRPVGLSPEDPPEEVPMVRRTKPAPAPVEVVVEEVLQESPQVEEVAVPVDEPQGLRYIVSPRDGAKGWYNVVDSTTGKAVNYRALRESEAHSVAKELNDGNTN